MNTKKHILKPGRHQFAPGSHAAHHNDNLSDEEAGWYLDKYPHIAQLFFPIYPEESLSGLEAGEGIKSEKKEKKKMKETKENKKDQVELLTPPSGGKEGL